jgi:hypothetical protein
MCAFVGPIKIWLHSLERAGRYRDRGGQFQLRSLTGPIVRKGNQNSVLFLNKADHSQRQLNFDHIIGEEIFC